jgi:transmembrane sensor
VITDVCMEHAIRVWTQRHSGRWQQSDESELQAWLAAASENREAYEKVARAWAVAGNLNRPVLTAQPEISSSGVQHRGFSPRSRIALAACAAALLAATAVPIWKIGAHWWNGSEVHLSTGKGKPESFVLADGTKVLLDADSDATANIDGRARRVYLKRGEALLTVSHETWRSFEVVVGAGRVRDLGTQFDIETVGGATRISVLEGRVGVSTLQGEALLVAGQAGGYDSNGTLLMQKSLDAAATRWSEGQRHFEDERLSDVLARLARYHAVAFVFSDERLQDLRVSGTFRIADLGLFLRTLGAALPIDVHYLDPQHVQITPRARAPSPDSRPNQRPSDRR